MLSDKQIILTMYEMLSDHNQKLVADLISQLLPDDVATPDDLEAIAEGRKEYLKGETVPMEEINWDA